MRDLHRNIATLVAALGVSVGAYLGIDPAHRISLHGWYDFNKDGIEDALVSKSSIGLDNVYLIQTNAKILLGKLFGKKDHFLLTERIGYVDGRHVTQESNRWVKRGPIEFFESEFLRYENDSSFLIQSKRQNSVKSFEVTLDTNSVPRLVQFLH